MRACRHFFRVGCSATAGRRRVRPCPSPPVLQAQSAAPDVCLRRARRSGPPRTIRSSAPAAHRRRPADQDRRDRLVVDLRRRRELAVATTIRAGSRSSCRRCCRNIPITVINRGVNGETAREMLARFNRDVFAENPDLVLWQVGSNSVLRERAARRIASAQLREGLKRLRSSRRRRGADQSAIRAQGDRQTRRRQHGRPDRRHRASDTNVDLFSASP